MLVTEMPSKPKTKSPKNEKTWFFENRKKNNTISERCSGKMQGKCKLLTGAMNAQGGIIFKVVKKNKTLKSLLTSCAVGLRVV